MQTNPLLTDSPLPYGAPRFDRIRTEHYLPAFEQAIAEAKAEIDAIVANPEAPTFANTVEALEYSGGRLGSVSGIFYNLLEADSDEEMQKIAEEISPMMTEYSMYVSLNEKLFARIKAVYDSGEQLEPDQAKLLEDTYKSFERGGANLSAEDKKTYSALKEQLELLKLEFSNNALAATNAYTLNITDEDELEGLPDFVRESAASTAAEKGQQGWTFDLSYPSYSAFMKYSARPDLRKRIYLAYNSRAFGGEYDNSDICRRIAGIRLRIAKLLGYDTYAEYSLGETMAGNVSSVEKLLDDLLGPSLPAAREEAAALLDFARRNGYSQTALQAWDFSYWEDKYKEAEYKLSDAELKPYFQLDSCIDAVFGLATRLYGVRFEARPDIPAYHKDVRVYDVKDADGTHLALLYADFFPRASKRSGAWMTNFREQQVRGGRELRPLVSIVTNFSKPTPGSPSLLTHYELTTLMHEFGHSLHGMLAKGRYPSLTGTNVSRDFVELPSQIMENWGYEADFLKPFARHYKTGEEIPDSLIDRIYETKNYLSAYYQVRQLQFGLLDMAWHNRTTSADESLRALEDGMLSRCTVLPYVPGTAISTSFSHIFSGGYSAGYYSYKWSEVLSADAYSLFKEKGIYDPGTAAAFRHLLENGGMVDEERNYLEFRGHRPDAGALLDQLGIKTR